LECGSASSRFPTATESPLRGGWRAVAERYRTPERVRSNAGLVAQQSSADIPTASELGLFVLALMLGALAILKMR